MNPSVRLAGVGLAAALALAGCTSTTTAPAPAGTAAGTAASSAAAPASATYQPGTDVPKEIVTGLLVQSGARTKTFAATTTAATAISGQTMNSTIDMVGDMSDTAKPKAKMTTSYGGQSIEIIMVGDTYYMKLPGQAKYTKTTKSDLEKQGGASSTATQGNLIEQFKQLNDAIKSAKFVGSEKVGDSDTKHFSATLDGAKMSMSADIPLDLYFDNDGMLRKMVMDIKDTSVSVKTDMVFTQYNQPVTITEPSPSEVQ